MRKVKEPNKTEGKKTGLKSRENLIKKKKQFKENTWIKKISLKKEGRKKCFNKVCVLNLLREISKAFRRYDLREFQQKRKKHVREGE